MTTWYQSQIVTKEVENDGEINDVSTQANITQDVAGKKGYKKKRNVASKIHEVPLKVDSNEGLHPQEPSATEASEDDVGRLTQ